MACGSMSSVALPPHIPRIADTPAGRCGCVQCYGLEDVPHLQQHHHKKKGRRKRAASDATASFWRNYRLLHPDSQVGKKAVLGPQARRQAGRQRQEGRQAGRKQGGKSEAMTILPFLVVVQLRGYWDMAASLLIMYSVSSGAAQWVSCWRLSRCLTDQLPS